MILLFVYFSLFFYNSYHYVHLTQRLKIYTLERRLVSNRWFFLRVLSVHLSYGPIEFTIGRREKLVNSRRRFQSTYLIGTDDENSTGIRFCLSEKFPSRRLGRTHWTKTLTDNNYSHSTTETRVYFQPRLHSWGYQRVEKDYDIVP